MSTAAEKRHMAAVAALGCIICRRPAQVHHCTGLAFRCVGKKASNYDVIPLCPIHHTEGGHGVAVHKGMRTWEENFGTQTELLERVRRLLAAHSTNY